MITRGSTSTSATVRILVVEDHPVVREGLAGLLAREAGFTVSGSAGAPAEARALAVSRATDVILLDLLLDDADGLSLIKELATVAPAARVLVFSLQPENVYAARCLRAGARGYVMKSAPLPVLYAAIREVAAGRIAVSPAIAGAALEALHAGAAPADAAEARLTDRELHVYRLTGLALPTREIAEKLGVSVKTIETHRENIKNKLGLATHAALVARAALWVRQTARG